ncbi:MAG: hypothetical protein FJW20_16775 [Acidimicrobiia bacterium]|nr:hypothetical protein [Acidimicrobiia bacterium]
MTRPGRPTKVRTAILVILFTLLMVAGFELVLRATYWVRNLFVGAIALPYAVGDDYGPIPPWVDGLRILVPDEHLIWRNRPSLRRTYVDIFSPVPLESERTALLRQFIPTLPESLQGNPTWEISVNSDGFRDTEFPRSKPASSFRILCIGDSWTFGANVGQEEAYPQGLRKLLRGEYPGAPIEVFNLGVLGYSSFQGLELLKRKALAWQPDLLVVGFAMNDASVSGYRDKDMPGQSETATFRTRVAQWTEHVEFYKLLRYLALLVRYQPKSTGDRLKALRDSQTGEATAEQYAEWEPWTRVSMPDYEENIGEMIRLARTNNASILLLYNSLEESPYRTSLKKLASRHNVPLIDSKAIIEEARQAIQQRLEAGLGLVDPIPLTSGEAGETVVTFRVYAGKHPVPRAIYIAGTHPRLGDLVPNTVAMHDDGTQGDQRAGDKVWTYQAALPGGTKILYTYTNSGEQKKWEGLDVPGARRFTAAEGAAHQVLPMATFGEILLKADTWHTNAAGYEMIAQAVLDSLKRDAGFRGFVGADRNDGEREGSTRHNVRE